MKMGANYKLNKLAKLRDAIAISKSETVTHSLTDPLTGVGARRCYRDLKTSDIITVGSMNISVNIFLFT